MHTEEKGTRSESSGSGSSLLDSELFFQTIGHPTLILDPDHRVISANRAALDLTGRNQEDLRGRKCHEVFHGRNRPAPDCPMERMKRSGQLESNEMEVEALGGVFLVSCTPLFDGEGSLAGVLHIATDITEQRRAEMALRASEEKFRTFVNSAPVGIVLLDLDGRLTACNPATERLTGYPVDEIEGKRFEELAPLSRETISWIRGDLARLRAGKASGLEGELELEIRHRDGSARWISIKNRVLREPEGVRGVLVIARDLTERKRTEEALGKISRTATEFVELKPRHDIYGFICERLEDLVGDAVIAVNAFDPEEGLLSTRGIAGLDPPTLEQVGALLGAGFPHVSFRDIDEDVRQKLYSGKLQRVEDGLYGIFFGRLDRSVCRALEDLAGVKAVYSIGFRRGRRLFGNASIFTRGETRIDANIVETFINLASIALERWHAEGELRESEERFRGIYSRSPIGIGVCDAAGRFVDANPAGLEIFGVERVQDMADFRLFDDPSMPADQRDRLRGGGSVQYEWVLRFDDIRREGHYRTSRGGTCHLDCLITPLDAAGSTPGGYLVQVQDISERKHAERERERLVQDLREAISRVRTLSGLLPICSSCKKIRDDRGYWNQIEAYIRDHSEAEFSHGICPECARRLYPDYAAKIYPQEKEKKK